MTQHQLPPLPTDVLLAGDFITRETFDQYNEWRKSKGYEPIASFLTRAQVQVSDEQIDALVQAAREAAEAYADAVNERHTQPSGNPDVHAELVRSEDAAKSAMDVAFDAILALRPATQGSEAVVATVRIKHDPESGEWLGTDDTAQATAAQGEPVALDDDDENSLFHVISMLDSIVSGQTVTSSDRLYDQSVRPRKMTIKDAQAKAEPAAKILRKLADKLRSMPAPQPAPVVGDDVVRNAARYQWLRDNCLDQEGNSSEASWSALHFECQYGLLDALDKGSLDAAIDAALAAAQKGGE